MARRTGKLDEPVMSDLTILVSVEDLINTAMGPSEKNVVNYKMIQTVLHILARQLRLLKTQVELRVTDEYDIDEKKRKKKKSERSSSSPSSSTSAKREMKDIQEERDREKAKKKERNEKEKADAIEEEKMDKMSAHEREIYLKEKAKKALKKSKKDKEPGQEKDGSPRKGEEEEKDREKIERDKAQQISHKEKAKHSKEKEGKRETSPDKDEKYFEEKKKEELLKEMSPKDKAKYLKEKEIEEKALQEMSPREKNKYLKEKEEKLVKEMAPKDKAKYLKEKEKEEKSVEEISSKEKAKHLKEKEEKVLREMSPKEKAKHLKEKEKEEKAVKEMSPREKEKYLKEKEEKALKEMSPREKAKYLKAKQDEEKVLKDMSPREKAKYLKEKEEEENALQEMSPKEKAKYLKEKEEKALQGMSRTEKQKYLKEKEEIELEKKKGRTASEHSISIREVERNKEKVLIVEKGPTTRASSRTRVGSIDVVTHSQFSLLEEAVNKLKEIALPPPMPSLPANKKLRSDLAKGSASLTDTMEALQVSARVQAAEQGLSRMAKLLTQLAAAGALPEDFASQFEDVKAEMEALKGGKIEEDLRAETKEKGSKADKPHGTTDSGKSSRHHPSPTGTRRSRSEGAVARSASASTATDAASRAPSPDTPRPLNYPVSREDFETCLQRLRDEIMKNINSMSNKTSAITDNAAGAARNISEKMEIAQRLDNRLNHLFDLTSDYAEQLSGFDAGLVSQMTSFQEQMAMIREDLKSGMSMLASANNNAETAAVMELTERYDGLVVDLESTLAQQRNLIVCQNQLTDELHSLVQAVETMREQKADRDEVLDGLRDKADISKLSGLLTEEDFHASRVELEERLVLCYDKFHKQELVWMEAIKDLTDLTEEKAEIIKLFSIKEEAQDAIRSINEKLAYLAIQLGEPKAAMLTRVLSKEGRCGACLAPALMAPEEHTSGKPPPLPPFLPPPDGGEPCAPPPISTHVVPDEKCHACKRWVGGSHTLLSSAVTREVAPDTLRQATPMRKYTGYGADGKLYNMEEELMPCVECNVLSKDVGEPPCRDVGQPPCKDACACAGDTGFMCPCCQSH